MTLLRFTVLAAGLALAAAECGVCHLHYFHKDVATAEIFGADVSQCRQYASESCCTPATAKGISTDVGKYLYGEGYDIHSCGTLSSKCEKFFIEENCLYECDKNVGKWRKHEDCTETTSGDNGWQIENMPIKSSYCDSWYEACKEESICAGPTRSFFEMPDCLALNKRNNNTAGCKRFKDVYTNGKDVCEVMWGNSFKYETDETKAYVMTFPEGTENPNNNVLTDVPYPPVCDGQEVNVTHPHLNADGSRITAEEAGCTADWHMLPDSGHPDAAKSGLLVVVGDSAAAASGRPAAAAAIFVSAAVLMLLA